MEEQRGFEETSYNMTESLGPAAQLGRPTHPVEPKQVAPALTQGTYLADLEFSK